MKLRTFTAPNMQDAMEQVRASLGDDAVIISTKKHASSGVQITAAFDDVAREEDEDAWYEQLRSAVAHTDEAPARERAPQPVVARIEQILHHHGVSESLTEHLIEQLERLTQRDAAPFGHYSAPVQPWLSALIAKAFDCAPLQLRDDSCRHIFIGTPGAGKTLTVAKIAAYCVKHQRPVHVITTDNKRAGGVEQLAAITDILNIELLVAQSPQELKTHLSDIPLAETVVIDSGGANPYDFYELKHLSEYTSLIDVQPVLVYPAGGDPYEAEEVARAFSFIGVEKMIITRTDAARRFGSVYNAAFSAGLKFANITGSEKILGTFDPCTPESLTTLLMDFQPDEPPLSTTGVAS